MKPATLVTYAIVIALVAGVAWVLWKELNPQAAAEARAAMTGGELLFFYADWCGPCKSVKPVVAEFADARRGELSVRRLNVDSNRELARQYEVRSIPCLIMTRNGREVARHAGTISRPALEAFVAQ